jgi:glucosamine-6-phosphate deaminase
MFTKALQSGLPRFAYDFTNGGSMNSRLVVLKEPADVYLAFAKDLAGEIQRANEAEKGLNLILPIGPIAQYPILAEICNRNRISFRNVFISLMDEYLDWQGRPIPLENPLSFQAVFEDFLEQLDEELRPLRSQWIVPDPFEIDRVEKFFKSRGGVDVCYGGVGVHGHIAFNEPPVSRYGKISLPEFSASKTRVVVLAPETFVINALRAKGGDFKDFPTMAVTIGMELILSSKKIRLFCDGGTRQQEAIYRFENGDVDVSYPISILRQHPDVLLTADELSALKASKSG